MKLYLAGPMTGKPYFNFPAFDAMAGVLRSFGHKVVSPAELDDPETRKASLESTTGKMQDGKHNGQTWGDFLARDVKLIADDGIEGIVCLEGWEESRGARLETFVGRLKGLPLYTVNPRTGGFRPVAKGAIQKAHGAEWFIPVEGEGLTVWSVYTPSERYRSTLEGAGRKGTGVKVTRTGANSRPTRVVNEKTGGEKDAKAEDYSLLPWEQMEEVARLYHRGAEKYDRDNWKRAYDWSLSFSALVRHATAFWRGQSLDPETECHHLASVIFHALALMYFEKHHPELDDRGV